MQQFGVVLKVFIVMNDTAYVFFKSFTDGKFPTQHELDGNQLYIGLQSSEGSRSIMLSKEGFVAGFSFDNPEVWIHFSQYGSVNKVTYNKPKKQKKRKDGYDYCFLKFDNYDSAAKAIAASPHCFGKMKVFAKFAKDF